MPMLKTFVVYGWNLGFVPLVLVQACGPNAARRAFRVKYPEAVNVRLMVKLQAEAPASDVDKCISNAARLNGKKEE